MNETTEISRPPPGIEQFDNAHGKYRKVRARLEPGEAIFNAWKWENKKNFYTRLDCNDNSVLQNSDDKSGELSNEWKVSISYWINKIGTGNLK